MKKVSTVNDIELIQRRGPWLTKSNGQLNILLALPWDKINARFFRYDPVELEELPDDFDIQGLRLYSVSDLPANGVGGGEFHYIREEIVICLDGAVEWECEDLTGKKKSFLLKAGEGIWMPPHILHTYVVIENKSSLLVCCNTLFDPEDKRTHDTYPVEDFRKLQERLKDLKSQSQ